MLYHYKLINGVNVYNVMYVCVCVYETDERTKRACEALAVRDKLHCTPREQTRICYQIVRGNALSQFNYKFLGLGELLVSLLRRVGNGGMAEDGNYDKYALLQNLMVILEIEC